jgi:prepilin-type N-terminal cleavage/methylation domain-containing protein
MRIKNHKGFTFIELIMVLVVATVIAVIVISRLMSSGTELIAQTDVIKAHLRYAQARAMGSDVIWGIEFKGSTYSLFKNGNTSDTVTLIGEDSDTLNLHSGISVSGIVSFDSWGKPYSDASGQTGHPGGQIVGLSINITQNTGFIE